MKSPVPALLAAVMLFGGCTGVSQLSAPQSIVPTSQPLSVVSSAVSTATQPTESSQTQTRPDSVQAASRESSLLSSSVSQTCASMPSDSEAKSSLSVTLSSDTVAPGELIAVRVEGSTESLFARYSEAAKRIFPLSRFGDRLVGLVPLGGSASKVGRLQLLVRDGNGYKTVWEKAVKLADKTFERQDITVTSGSSMATAGSSTNLSDDKMLISAATADSAAKPLFTGEFVMPAQGRVSTGYGMRRYTNGSFTSAHSGYDIAADEGDDVCAAAAGKVTFAGELKFYGNTVIIDHGMNIFTLYHHMSELLVFKGMQVKTGELVGEVGTTGYSTGPHLHFTLTVNGVNVDPAVFMDTDYIYTQLERMINQ